MLRDARRRARRPRRGGAAADARDRGRLLRHLEDRRRSCSRCRCSTATTASATACATRRPRCWSPTRPTRTALDASLVERDPASSTTSLLGRRLDRRSRRPTPPPTTRRSSTTPRARPGWPRASSTPTATCSPTRSSSTATTSGTASASTAWASGRGRPGSRRCSGRGASARVQVVYQRKGGFDPHKQLDFLSRHEVTNVFTTPTAMRSMMADRRRRHALPAEVPHRLLGRRAAQPRGDPLVPRAVRAHRARLLRADRVLSARAPTTRSWRSARARWAGRCRAGTSQILDEDERPVAQGERGEICLRARSNPHYPLGYWRNAGGRREETFGGDWFHTKDAATQDEDGYFWYEGRADDVIIAAGYRIGPFEVESACLEHPAVARGGGGRLARRAPRQRGQGVHRARRGPRALRRAGRRDQGASCASACRPTPTRGEIEFVDRPAQDADRQDPADRAARARAVGRARARPEARIRTPAGALQCSAMPEHAHTSRQRAAPVPRRAASLRRARPAPRDGARSQGRPRGGRRPARGAVRRCARARPADAHRGRRHHGRRRGRPVRARTAAGGRCVGSAADVVAHQRRLAGQPGGVPGHRPARRSRRRAAHRPRQHDRRPRPRGTEPTFVAPEVDARALHRALRAACGARRGAGAHARRRGGDRRLADLLRRGGRRRGPRPRRPRPRRAARRRRGVGRAPGLLRRAPRARAGAGADLVISSTHKHARQPDPVGDAAPRGRRALRRGRRRPRAAARHLDEPEQSAARLAGRGAPPRGGRRRGAAATLAVAELAALRAEIRRIRGLDVLDERVVGSLRRRGDRSRCGVCVDVRGRASAASRWRGGCAATATSTSSCAASTSSSRCSGSASASRCTARALVERAGARRAGARRRWRYEHVTVVPRPEGVGPTFDPRGAGGAPWGEAALSPRAAFLAAPERVADRAGRGPDRGGVPGRLSARDPQRAPRRAPHGGEPGQPAAHAAPRRRGPWRRRPDPATRCSSWPSPRRSRAVGARLRLERAVA